MGRGLDWEGGTAESLTKVPCSDGGRVLTDTGEFDLFN